MAPLVKFGLAGSLLAGLVAAITSRLTRRRKRKAVSACSCDEPATGTSASVDVPDASCSTSSCPGPATASSETPWYPSGVRQRSQRHKHSQQHHSLEAAAAAAPTAQPGRRTSTSLSLGGREGRSSEWQQGSGQGPGLGSSSSGLLSRLLAAGRPSESLESAISYSAETVGSSTQGGDEYDSSEEQDGAESYADSRSGYGKSDRARLVDLWIESALLVSRDVRLDKRHFDRTTRQNLKKMRPASAQLILSEIADRSWESTPDIAKEIHRLVSHAKAQDKFAAAPPSGSLGLGLGVTSAPGGSGVGLGGGGVAGAMAGGGGGTAATVSVTSLLASGRGGGAVAAATAGGGPGSGPGLGSGSMRMAIL